MTSAPSRSWRSDNSTCKTRRVLKSTDRNRSRSCRSTSSRPWPRRRRCWSHMLKSVLCRSARTRSRSEIWVISSRPSMLLTVTGESVQRRLNRCCAIRMRFSPRQARRCPHLQRASAWWDSKTRRALRAAIRLLVTSTLPLRWREQISPLKAQWTPTIPTRPKSSTICFRRWCNKESTQYLINRLRRSWRLWKCRREITRSFGKPTFLKRPWPI